MESSRGFIVASNGCVEFRLEVGRTTFFSRRIGRLRVLVRFLRFRTSLRVGVGQRFFGLRHISEVFVVFKNRVNVLVLAQIQALRCLFFENLSGISAGSFSCWEVSRSGMRCVVQERSPAGQHPL